ncbi:MAG: Multidrug resistance protein MdtA [Chlamydiae bacterium]|nr:Multidrug resistance protein MdtA [Chlamydiota bacterium]
MKIRRVALTLVCLFLILSGCSKKNDIKKPPPPAPVKTAYAEMKDIPFYIDTIGHFVAYNTVTIQAQIQGELTGLYFTEGQEVNQGDILFTIDAKPYQAVLDKAVAMLRQNEALYAYNKSRADRYSQLVGDDFVSVLDYEKYISEMKNYDALINQDLADIESAEINVGYCSLEAPISGVTGKRLVDVGNIITDVGSELLVINQMDPMFIDFSIPERHFDVVFQNQQISPLKVEIYVPNTPLKTTACLQMLDNTVNQKTGMIAARGILENENKHFWPEQFVRIRLIVYMMNNSIMVPNGAVIPGPDGELVWVVDSNNEVRPVDVKLGELYEGQTQIVSGLNEGDQVVIYGQLGLVKGRKVVINKDKGENF